MNYNTEDQKEFDIRQLKLILTAISEYEKNLINLSSLVFNLESLVGYLQLTTDNIKQEMGSYIGNIEIINAISLDDSNNPLDVSNLNIYIDRISEIVNKQLEFIQNS